MPPVSAGTARSPARAAARPGGARSTPARPRRRPPRRAARSGRRARPRRARPARPGACSARPRRAGRPRSSACPRPAPPAPRTSRRGAPRAGRRPTRPRRRPAARRGTARRPPPTCPPAHSWSKATRVHVHRRVQPDPVARCREQARAGDAPQRPQRVAQACPCPVVEDVGPEPPRDRRPRVRPGMQREPREHEVRPPGVRQLDCPPVHLDGQLPQHAHPEHAQNVIAEPAPETARTSPLRPAPLRGRRGRAAPHPSGLAVVAHDGALTVR